MIKKLSFTLLLALTASIGFAQQNKISFEKYDVAEGLPEEFARCMVQDDRGFMWLGTQNGLVKYDGYQFKVYSKSPDDSDTTGFQFENIYGLLKTRDGKIWIAANSGRGGIACFDPATETFRHFYPDSNKWNNTEQDFSHLLFEDTVGNIWFKNGSNKNGQAIANTTCRLDPLTGIIKQYPECSNRGNTTYFNGFNHVESAGNVWLLDNNNNLNRFNRQEDRFEVIIPAGATLPHSIKSDTLGWISAASNDRLILSSRHGVHIFDSKHQKITSSYVHSPGNPASIPDSSFLSFELMNGQIWVNHPNSRFSLIDTVSSKIETYTYGKTPVPYQSGIKKINFFWRLNQTKEGVWFYAWTNLVDSRRPTFFLYYRFATKTFTLYDHNFNDKRNQLAPGIYVPYVYTQDRTGLLWLGTRPGFYKQSPKKQQMDLFRYRADDPNGIPSDKIRYLFEDSKKRLWVGTQDGLALYQPGEDNFKIFRNDPSKNTSLSNNDVRTVIEDANGRIWVGTANGLNQWQESSGTFKRFFYAPGEINRIEFVFPDKQQRLWLSIWEKGVFVLDKNTGRVIKSYTPDAKNPASLTSNQINMFYQDSRGTIWLGDRSDNQYGLYKLNPNGDGFTHYLPIPGDSTSISNNEIHFMAEDGKQRLWIGTDGGLNLYNHDKGNFTRYGNAYFHSISGFTTDKDGEPWFSNYGSRGLVSVDAEKGIITSYDETKGLLQTHLRPGLNWTIAKDDFGRFWLPTARGLSVFDPETKTFTSYFEKDGFQTYDRNYASIRTSNGDIWIGSDHGLNHIVPANLLKKDTTVPSIVITQVGINDSIYAKPDGIIFKQSVAYTNKIKLEHWQKDLSFDFVALHFLRSADNLYSWKLENYDKEWSAPSRERKASYTNLSPGEYIFRVKASNADNVWNEEGISLAITILPPWWLTWWAYLIYGLLFLAALRIFSMWRERKLRQEKDLLQVKVEDRTRELKESLEHLKSTQSQLIHSEKMASLGELTAGIAHEIQNPLNFVNNFSDVNKELIAELRVELAKGNLEEVDQIANDIEGNEEKIIYHGKRADSIVKGMLAHSRTSNGEKELTDINALANEYLRLAYHGLRAKDKSFNADFKTELDPHLPKVNIIPQDIGRVFLNLINNAFQAVAEVEKPIVKVITLRTENGINICISDNGPGIPDSIKEKIFQPFFTTKPTGQGTGLGLSLSYDIVKAHGGEIKVSTKENEETEFIIQLPIQ